jgi:uncharacterized protein (DUF3084 family)
MKRRGYDEELKDIPSMSMSDEDVEDYHRSSNRPTYQDHYAESEPASTLSLWLVLIVVIGVMLVGGYFIADLRYQLNASQQTLQMTTTQIDTLSSTDKKVSSTGSALQDQLKTLKNDVKKMQEQLSKLQQENQKALEQQAQATTALDKKMSDITAKLDENKTALTATQEALKKNQPNTAGTLQQSAQLKALESKVNELSLDVMAKQEQAGGVPATDSQKLAQIDEQLKSIDAYRQSMNANINKMQNDINKLYIDIDTLR